MAISDILIESIDVAKSSAFRFSDPLHTGVRYWRHCLCPAVLGTVIETPSNSTIDEESWIFQYMSSVCIFTGNSGFWEKAPLFMKRKRND